MFRDEEIYKAAARAKAAATTIPAAWVTWAAAPVKVAGVEAVVTVPLLEAVMSVPVPAREVTIAEEVADGVTAAVE